MKSVLKTMKETFEDPYVNLISSLGMANFAKQAYNIFMANIVFNNCYRVLKMIMIQSTSYM